MHSQDIACFDSIDSSAGGDGRTSSCPEVHVGLDVHAATVSVAVALADGSPPVFHGKVDHRVAAIGRLVETLRERHRGSELVFWQEAGPCGFELHRRLEALGCQSWVIAPSKVTLQTGRIKTDRRDAEELSRAGRGGILSAIWVPDSKQESIRGLCRCRTDAVRARRRARQQLSGFLLRHGRHYGSGEGEGEGGASWTGQHRRWLEKQSFTHAADQVVFEDYLSAVDAAGVRVAALTKELERQVSGWELEPLVRAYMAMRGVDRVVATTLAAELGDLSRFSSPRQLMAYLGLVPSEHSSGGTRKTGGITRAGNGHVRRMLVESAWTYRYPARLSETIRRRVEAAPAVAGPIAWKAQKRLCGRYRHLTTTLNKRTQVACAAVAREMCGFIWAIAEQVREMRSRVDGGVGPGKEEPGG